MNYSANYQQQGYDPSSQTPQFYNQPTENYYPYSYPNPQYAITQPHSYHSLNVQPSQHEEQEPNPPGVTVPQPPQQDQNAYYQYYDHGAAAAVLAVGPQQGGVDAGVAMVQQPKLSVHGTQLAELSGLSISALYKHATPPAQDQTISIQGSSHIQVGPPQPMPQSYASSFGPIPTPFQGPAHSTHVLPPSKKLWCELCSVECNSIEIFNLHQNGKKHQKKLKTFEDLQNPNKGVVGRQMEQTLTSELKSEDQIEASGVQQLELPRCELCKVDCNSLEILNQHKNGKKHMKKLKMFEKLQNRNKSSIGQQMEQSTSELKSEVPSQPDQTKASENQQPQQESLPSQDINEETIEKQKVEEVEPTEETEEKVTVDGSESLGRGFKRKMRGCHLVGKKHQLNAKRFMSHQEALGQQILQTLAPVLQALHQQNPNNSTPFASQLHFQGLAPNTNLESAQVEAISQPQSLPANFGPSVTFNAERNSNEGHSESGVPINYPTGSLDAAKMESVATGTEPITFETTPDVSMVGPSSSQVAHFGPDTIMGLGQVQSEGRDQAQ
ncbi:hypothetical protein DH2020_045535 [Rehmannia glutinosa]|uniref:U1-type domain-containing protein n=1 Tax=Rehmannia glutinosa TaxID=99300 RepID=A0ABR0UEH6_REHGL